MPLTDNETLAVREIAHVVADEMACHLEKRMDEKLRLHVAECGNKRFVTGGGGKTKLTTLITGAAIGGAVVGAGVVELVMKLLK